MPTISHRPFVVSKPKQNTSIWLALRNPAFVGLWFPSVVSGVCVAAHDTAATWLMNALGASPLLLSLIATAASLPFFLFTLPAGALADLSNRRNLLIAVYLWLAIAAGLLAFCTWLHWIHPYVILITVFLLGIGFAFNAPVWASIVPEIVQKEELASAITLGGVQMNLSGIVGPALGGLLLPIVGPAMLFSLNALAFLTMAWIISQRYHRRRRPEPHLEGFLESFASAARYVRYTPGMQVILTRDFLFGLFIAVVPALVPVVALQHLRLQASQLGLVFTSMGIGSLLGATLLLPYARAKASPNTLTILAGVIQVAVLVLMAIVPNLWLFLPVTALAGISWTVSASELWIAGQRAMPDWARGRMNAVHLMASQGGVAVGGVCWGASAASAGLGPTLMGGALLLTASLALAIPLSINFAHSLNLDPAPLKNLHEFSLTPKPDERARHGHAGANHSPGRPGRIPCLDQTGSVDLFAQRRFSFPRRREPRTFRHFPDRNARQLLGGASETVCTLDESRNRACRACVGDARRRRRTDRASLPSGQPAMDSTRLQSVPKTT
jgi:MFS family permease